MGRLEQPGEWRSAAQGNPWVIRGRAPRSSPGGGAHPGPPAMLLPALLIPGWVQSAALALGAVWHGLPPAASAQLVAWRVGVQQELPEAPPSECSAGCSALAAGDGQPSWLSKKGSPRCCSQCPGDVGDAGKGILSRSLPRDGERLGDCGDE